MKLGLGLYRHMLTRENFQFARQAGATHVVAHLVDYFKGGAKNPRDNQPTGTERGWGQAGDPDKLCSAINSSALHNLSGSPAWPQPRSVPVGWLSRGFFAPPLK